MSMGGGVGQLGMAHQQKGQPPRLGCLGMCTGQCAVVDVNSKCWRNMLEPGWALEARRKASEARRRASEGACNFDRGEVQGPSLTERRSQAHP